MESYQTVGWRPLNYKIPGKVFLLRATMKGIVTVGDLFKFNYKRRLKLIQPQKISRGLLIVEYLYDLMENIMRYLIVF